MVFRSDARDLGECPVQVCHVGADAFLEASGSWSGHVLELVLDGVDAADELGRVCLGDQTFDLVASLGQDEPGAAVGPVLLVESFESLPWGRGLVVDAPGSSVAGAGASHGFLGRGEQVDLDAHELPQLVQQIEFGEFVPVVERVFAYDVVVAGFDGGLVVLPVGAASGLLDVELLEVGDEVRVDELAAVVVVVGADREREPLLDHGLGLGEVAVRVVAGGRVLGPSGGEVDHGQGAAELALEAGAAVGDGVGLHVAGQAVQLVAGFPDRDRVAQQLAGRTRSRQTLGAGGVTQGLEVPVNCGSAHRHELAEREPVIGVQLPAIAQHGQPLRQHRLQILATRHIHQHPHPYQQLSRLVRIPARPLPRRRHRAVPMLPGLGEQAPGRAPAYPQCLAHPVQDDALLLLRRPHVLVPEPEGDLPLRRHADPVFHTTSQTDQPGFALTPGEAPLPISRSKNVRHVVQRFPALPHIYDCRSGNK